MTTDVRVVYTEYDIERMDDNWETLVSAGQMIAEAHDRNRWTLGDLGGKVVRRYGDDSIGNFAAAINIRPSTMYDYTACSAFYNAEDRVAFPPLNWSHYRAALKAKEHDLAMTWLARAADEGWTVEELNEALKPAGKGGGGQPEKITEFGGMFRECRALPGDEGAEPTGYEVVIRLSKPVSLLDPGRVYTFKAFAVQAQSED